MYPIEIALIIEEERKKCLNTIKKYCNKHGNESVEKLYKYIQEHAETIDDSVLLKEIMYDVELLRDYMKE